MNPKDEVTVRTVRLLGELAEQMGMMPDSIVLGWLMRYPAKIQPILGSTKPERIVACRDSVKVAERMMREERHKLYISARGDAMPHAGENRRLPGLREDGGAHAAGRVVQAIYQRPGRRDAVSRESGPTVLVRRNYPSALACTTKRMSRLSSTQVERVRIESSAVTAIPVL